MSVGNSSAATYPSVIFGRDGKISHNKAKDGERYGDDQGGEQVKTGPIRHAHGPPFDKRRLVPLIWVHPAIRTILIILTDLQNRRSA
eukprot:scaffold23498_cov62-Attheya_sp.AAC.2